MTKIMEKTILVKLKQCNSKLLASQSYQREFKEGLKTTANISLAIQQIKSPRNRDKLHLFADLSKEFDSIDRAKLFHILEKRASSDMDRHTVALIRLLNEEVLLDINNETYRVLRGVPQGGVLSPLLFNLYLEEALLSQPTILRLIRRGNVRAFADDLVFLAFDTHEMRMIIELQTLES